MNKAIQGGCIYYSSYRPYVYSNYYDGNMAEYGNEIGSYPV